MILRKEKYVTQKASEKKMEILNCWHAIYLKYQLT
jgi:hypothetical protein